MIVPPIRSAIGRLGISPTLARWHVVQPGVAPTDARRRGGSLEPSVGSGDVVKRAMREAYQNARGCSTLGGMLDHSAQPPRTGFFSRRAATVGAEIPADPEPKATLGETLVFMLPAFVAGILLVATLHLVGSNTASKT